MGRPGGVKIGLFLGSVLKGVKESRANLFTPTNRTMIAMPMKVAPRGFPIWRIV